MPVRVFIAGAPPGAAPDGGPAPDRPQARRISGVAEAAQQYPPFCPGAGQPGAQPGESRLDFRVITRVRLGVSPNRAIPQPEKAGAFIAA